MKLESPTQYIYGGGYINAPASVISPETLTEIYLEMDTIKFQLEGALLYKLMPNESEITMPNSIYLVLAWKISMFGSLYAHMAIVEHDDYAVSLGSDTVEKHYYQKFRDELRKLKEAITCSWTLNENISFTIIMTAVDGKPSRLNVKIKAGKSEANYSKPTYMELVK
jgi:hypothetical protein